MHLYNWLVCFWCCFAPGTPHFFLCCFFFFVSCLPFSVVPTLNIPSNLFPRTLLILSFIYIFLSFSLSIASLSPAPLPSSPTHFLSALIFILSFFFCHTHFFFPFPVSSLVFIPPSHTSSPLLHLFQHVAKGFTQCQIEEGEQWSDIFS